MKIRTGFVSNSSSTSFVIATKNGEEPVASINFNDAYCTKISTLDELKDVKNELRTGVYARCVDIVSAGGVVWIGSVDRQVEGMLWEATSVGSETDLVTANFEFLDSDEC